MKKNKKFIILLFVVLFLAVAIPIVLYTANHIFIPENNVYETSWNITIPKQAEKLYVSKTPTDLHGDGCRYAIFLFEEKSSDFLKDFSNEKNEKIEEAVTGILNELAISDDNRLDFNHSYSWKQLKKNEGYDNLFLIYDEEQSKLYIVEENM